MKPPIKWGGVAINVDGAKNAPLAPTVTAKLGALEANVTELVETQG